MMNERTETSSRLRLDRLAVAEVMTMDPVTVGIERQPRRRRATPRRVNDQDEPIGVLSVTDNVTLIADEWARRTSRRKR
jgi:hypothetical protein